MTAAVTTPGVVDRALWADFETLCGFGGRVAGSPGEQAALDWALGRLTDIADSAGTPAPHAWPVAYAGWHCRDARLIDLGSGRALACTPLLGTAATAGIEAEVIDLGRGRPDDFDRHADSVRDRIVLVRHEYPFSTGHVHRRVKLGLAQRLGAVGFLIAHPEPEAGPVSGSSGRDGGPGIPALGIDTAAATALAAGPDGRRPIARIVIDGEDVAGRTRILTLDLPGRGPDLVVLSAHVDGHPHGESAIDNATGVAVALAVARRLAPRAAAFSHGLRVCLTSAEEWGLAGSRQWLAALPADERARMRLDVNLDSVGGAPHLTALTSDFPALDRFVRAVAAEEGLALATHLPAMPNSDHANFAAHGIPALRLIAGFDAPDSALRLLLTGRDRRDLVRPEELAAAVRTAAALVERAMAADAATLAALAVR
ncbi:M28 family peptidase [Rhodoplanes roseus]|uniref:M28 family peptidase n=1 Tax=Rhodoplanes roseus TaxID=29409 RepID=UPI001472A27F|nr:M28 family peptidase [Rhodoplanes roseus]